MTHVCNLILRFNLMEHGETLNTIAQIAISLVGFSGIVVIFGDRFKRKWTASEALQFYALLSAPITALLCSFLPELISTITNDREMIWRASNAILGLLHLSNFLYFVIKIRNAIFIQKIAGVTGVTTILVHFLTAINLIPYFEFVFIAGLLQQIVVGILNFVLLFRPHNDIKI